MTTMRPLLLLPLLAGCALYPDLQPGIEVWTCEVVASGPSGDHRVAGWGHTSGEAGANARRAARAGASVEHLAEVARAMGGDAEAWTERTAAWNGYRADEALAVPGWRVSPPSCQPLRLARRPGWRAGAMGDGPSRSSAPAAAEAGRMATCEQWMVAGPAEESRTDKLWGCLGLGPTWKSGKRSKPPVSNRWTCRTDDGRGHGWAEDPELAAASARLDGIANRAEARTAAVLRREQAPDGAMDGLVQREITHCSTGYPEPLIWSPEDIEEARDCGVAPGSGIDLRELTGGKIDAGRERLCRRTVWDFGATANEAVARSSERRREDLRRSAWGAVHRCHSACRTNLNVGAGPTFSVVDGVWGRQE